MIVKSISMNHNVNCSAIMKKNLYQHKKPAIKQNYMNLMKLLTERATSWCLFNPSLCHSKQSSDDLEE